MNRLFLLIFVCVLLYPSCVAADDQRMEGAKALFDTLISLSHEFNASVADLYSDDAVIKNIRHYPFGGNREMTMTGKEFKSMIKKTMPFAKLRNDISTFSDVSYAIEGDMIRIKATRYSELKKYSSPYSILVGSDDNGNWLIFEEISESKP